MKYRIIFSAFITSLVLPSQAQDHERCFVEFHSRTSISCFLPLSNTYLICDGSLENRTNNCRDKSTGEQADCKLVPVRLREPAAIHCAPPRTIVHSANPTVTLFQANDSVQRRLRAELNKRRYLVEPQSPPLGSVAPNVMPAEDSVAAIVETTGANRKLEITSRGAYFPPVIEPEPAQSSYTSGSMPFYSGGNLRSSLKSGDTPLYGGDSSQSSPTISSNTPYGGGASQIFRTSGNTTYFGGDNLQSSRTNGNMTSYSYGDQALARSQGMPNTSIQAGSMTIFDNGVSGISIGSSTIYSNGKTCRVSGSMIFCN